MLRVIFMGTPDFAVPTLREIVRQGHEVVAVYSQPPRRAGRGMESRPSPVASAAQEMGLELRTPASLKDEAEEAAFQALQADIAVVVAYGLILPRPILHAPRLGCLNLHPSRLPRWRGAAPIQRAIMAGDESTAVAVMQMESGLDTGPVYVEIDVNIGQDETSGELHERLAVLGAGLMARVLEGLSHGPMTARAQPEEGVTYARKIDKAEARRLVRARRRARQGAAHGARRGAW